MYCFSRGRSPRSALMHPDVEKLVEAGRIPPEVGERLSQLAPGQFVRHRAWGSGQVADWDLTGGKVIIDFEGKPKQEMALKFALQKLEPLADDAFGAQKVGQLDELKDLVKDDPIELVRRTIEGAGGSMTADQLERELKGSIIEEKAYKKWWDTTKKTLREKRAAVVPPRRTELITMRDPNASPGAVLVEEYLQAQTLKSRIKALDAIQADSGLFKEEADTLKPVLEDVNATAKKGLKLHLSDVLNLLACRNELVDGIEALSLGDTDFRISDVLAREGARVASAIGDIPVARQARLYAAYPTAFGDGWVEEILRALESTGGRGVAEIAKLLKAEDKYEALEQHLIKLIAARSVTPDVLVWLTRERAGLAENVFSLEVGTAILNALERDSLDDGPRRASRLQNVLLEDKTLIADMVEPAEEIEVRHFSKRLLSNPVYQDLDKKSLMARVIKARPEVEDVVTGAGEEAEDESFVSSWDSIQLRKDELDDISTNQIPQNRKDIKVAKAHGDLRENFEYHAAKQQQAILMRKQAMYQKDLANARGTDFKEVDTSSVNIGTVVSLDGPKGEVVYTILGAWDAVPEKNIFSYLSDVGDALMGHSVGDEVVLKDFESETEHSFKITAIKPYVS